MTTVQIGHQAEAAAAAHLVGLNYRIIELNWRTRWCEIDIIAQKADTLYFVEVKYRRSTYHGTGLEYVTPRKLKQMVFAANLWVCNNSYSGDYVLGAIEISGTDYQVGRLTMI